MIRKFGFTLAEVLITLGIIGVVAALTIPTLMQKTNDSELKAGYKKMISVLNQAISMNYALDGVDFSNISGLGASTDQTGNTWLGFIYRRLNVVGQSGNTIFFSDGSSVTVSDQGNCTRTSPCTITVDINGNKGPNRAEAASSTSNLGDQYTLYAFDRQIGPSTDGEGIGNWILRN